MALEPITRKEKIIAGQDLTPITRMEMFLKQHVGGGSVGGVQPDWNQNDETQPNYVKNRPVYQDAVIDITWDGNTEGLDAIEGFPFYKVSGTAPEKNDILGSEIVFEVGGVQNVYKVDNIGYYEGENYISISELACIVYAENANAFNGIIFPTTGVWFVSHGTAFTQSLKKTITKTLDAKYLPDTVVTKSDVEDTQEVLDGVFSSVATFKFDKQTSGRDTFNFNNFNYYKISDFNPDPENVISFKGTVENGNEQSEITIGSNCVEYGFFIVVASAGACAIPITETVTKSFTAPSAGLYARYEEGNTSITAGTGEFTLRASTGSSYITGLFLKSSTAESTKKFKITVDDSGTISATEVT